MLRFSHFVFLLALVAVAGCGEKTGPVGTEDEINAYIDEHGSTSDPGPSPLVD